jgi:anti-sigma regulatory factor (Ser/Thr protein kinase)
MMSYDQTWTDHDTIELRVPARLGAAATVRLITASLAADADFGLDDLDDLRLAVNEVFTCAVGDGVDGVTVVVCFYVGKSTFDVRISVDGNTTRIELDDLASSIIRSAVDVVRIEDGHVTLTKHRRPSSLDDR